MLLAPQRPTEPPGPPGGPGRGAAPEEGLGRVGEGAEAGGAVVAEQVVGLGGEVCLDLEHAVTAEGAAQGLGVDPRGDVNLAAELPARRLTVA